MNMPPHGMLTKTDEAMIGQVSQHCKLTPCSCSQTANAMTKGKNLAWVDDPRAEVLEHDMRVVLTAVHAASRKKQFNVVDACECAKAVSCARNVPFRKTFSVEAAGMLHTACLKSTYAAGPIDAVFALC